MAEDVQVAVADIVAEQDEHIGPRAAQVLCGRGLGAGRALALLSQLRPQRLVLGPKSGKQRIQRCKERSPAIKDAYKRSCSPGGLRRHCANHPRQSQQQQEVK